jgi:rhodanese-related sulfurtransferase
MIERIEPAELHRRLGAGQARDGQPPRDWVLLDVREAEELDICRLDGAAHIPLSELTARCDELDPERTVVCICHHGRRSAMAAGLLLERRFRRVINLTGGIDAWAEEVDPAMARY